MHRIVRVSYARPARVRTRAHAGGTHVQVVCPQFLRLLELFHPLLHRPAAHIRPRIGTQGGTQRSRGTRAGRQEYSSPEGSVSEGSHLQLSCVLQPLELRKAVAKTCASPGADVARGGPSPGADVARGGPSPGADVAGVSRVPVRMWHGVGPVPVRMWHGVGTVPVRMWLGWAHHRQWSRSGPGACRNLWV
jgi:hypothetical protein